MKSHPRALLADEAGLGKSAQLLLAAKEPVLIVAPAMVLESGTWDDEIEKWAPGIEATQVSYSSIAQRGPRGKVERDFNGFPLTPLKPEYRGRYGSAILDEAHYVKGRKTSWSVAVTEIDAPQIDLATGTPIPNWASESFMLLRMMWPDKAKAGHEYGSYWRWVQEWFEVYKNFHGGREVGDLLNDTEAGWDDFRRENWGDRMIRRLRVDCLDLPPLTHQDWFVEMSREQAKAYRDLRKDFVTWLDSGLEVDVWSEPGMLVKLAMIASGLETVDPDAKPSGKFKVLAQLLEDRPRPTLVVGHFRSTIDAAARVAERMGLSVGRVRGGMKMSERREAIRGFQRGDLQVLVASINTISEGLTLHQGGADQIIRLERSWTPSKNEQVDRRLHRIGVEKPVHSIDLITRGTIDQKILRVLDEKTDQQMKALRAVDLLPLA